MAKVVDIIVKDYIVRNRHFTIVKDAEDFYMAIEDKYITDGKMNTTLFGYQCFADKDFNGCLKQVANRVETDYLEEQGYSKADAFMKVFDLEGKVDKAQVEALFA